MSEETPGEKHARRQREKAEEKQDEIRSGEVGKFYTAPVIAGIIALVAAFLYLLYSLLF
jgi:hypothetical protein